MTTEPWPGPVDPLEAMQVLAARTELLPSWSWMDLWQAAHAEGIAVARMTDLDLLQSVKVALAEALAGTTVTEFKRQLEPVLKRAGWWGWQLLTDPATGVEDVVQLGSPRRLQLIFDANLRVSYAVGQWQRIQETKAERPYLRYSSVLDGRTRPLHREWHGIILPIDHLFWRTHFPPNGWRCRCTVSTVSDRDLARHGWKVAADPDIDPKLWVNKRTGETLMVPAGIDPGWDYNPGVAGAARLQRLLAERIAEASGPRP